mmetsp:Transcript_8223/g.25468  ORF Transcript_8223/g.25468 Transcript_8223/m.25468 type:complete len:400 (+) Transcript_8223:217-1416(+)
MARKKKKSSTSTSTSTNTSTDLDDRPNSSTTQHSQPDIDDVGAEQQQSQQADDVPEQTATMMTADTNAAKTKKASKTKEDKKSKTVPSKVRANCKVVVSALRVSGDAAETCDWVREGHRLVVYFRRGNRSQNHGHSLPFEYRNGKLAHELDPFLIQATFLRDKQHTEPCGYEEKLLSFTVKSLGSPTASDSSSSCSSLSTSFSSSSSSTELKKQKPKQKQSKATKKQDKETTVAKALVNLAEFAPLNGQEVTRIFPLVLSPSKKGKRKKDDDGKKKSATKKNKKSNEKEDSADQTDDASSTAQLEVRIRVDWTGVDGKRLISASQAGASSSSSSSSSAAAAAAAACPPSRMRFVLPVPRSLTNRSTRLRMRHALVPTPFRLLPVPRRTLPRHSSIRLRH